MQEDIGANSGIQQHRGLPQLWPVVSIIAVLIAIVIREWFLQSLGTRAAYVTFFPAVIIAALYGGLRGGLLATILSAIAVDLFIFKPKFHFALNQPADWLSMAIFASGCIMVSIITEAMRSSREKLVESEERFRTLANAMPQLAWIAHADGFIYWYNNRMYEYTGITPEQMKGWSWQSVIDPETLPRVLEFWKKSLTTGESFEIEFPIRRADGVYRLFLTRIMPLKNSLGQVVRWFGTNTDINELKLLEEQLARRANDLAALNRELESFSYSVTHDLRTPLSAMTGFIKILQEDYSEKLDDEGKEYLSIVAKSALRMNELIKDILSLSKVTRQEMQYRDVDLSAMAQAIIEDLSQSNPARIIDITIQENLHAFADENLLRLALQNLLSNAWKYTGKAQKPRIEFGTFDRDSKRIFYVKDNGAGFDMKDVDKLFVPFKRLHRESEFPGIGVGLPIVDRVIRRHGGRIWAESEIGKGATFFFTLS